MALPDCIRENVLMRELTTLGIGGPARWFAEPASLDELRCCLEFAAGRGVGVRALGGGSNLLVSDAGVDALVVRLSGEGEFARIRRDEGNPLKFRAGAAATLVSLVDSAARRGLSGLESLAGIPGRLGGAAVMNCGAGGTEIGRRITRARVCDQAGVIRELLPEEMAFSYRRSGLGDFIVLEFELLLVAEEGPEIVMERANRFKRLKRERQPLGFASAGCFFKNPPGQSAGALIDAAGCKGMSRGGAEVSAVHANFIVNRGGAACADVVGLAGAVRDIVRERDGIRLEPEVVMWGGGDAFACLREER